MLRADPLRHREIRVFISSTFRDMQEERDELVKRIFPQLRRLCESRGVTWGEVDLRWGVTDEARAEGNVLPLCLEEIEHCRPYFIGLLGQRYGWVPHEIPLELLRVWPWLDGHRDDSVTALEIRHGALLNPPETTQAYFYLRDPDCATSREGFEEDDPARAERLSALKADIRNSRFPVRENFMTPQQFGQWVLRDFTSAIEALYPDPTPPHPLDRAAADHEAYAASRRKVYIGRREYFERLHEHAGGHGPPLVVLGESGGGKSALLSNWISSQRDRYPEVPVIVHFVGASPDSADWVAMLRRLLDEFSRLFGIQFEIPDRPAALRVAFANALHTVAAQGRIVVVVDALNQLDDHDGALDLIWLPPMIPANVRLVLSTLPGPVLDALTARGWQTLAVRPLEPEERDTLTVDYLHQFSKELSKEQRWRITTAPQSANGLYLTTLLNELRIFGIHDELDRRIDWYMEAVGPIQLYGKVIQRWNQDYGQPHPLGVDVVRDSLCHLWAARRGLSEAELLDILGTDGAPLPRAIWSPLFLEAGDAFVNRGGMLTFAHTFLRDAIQDSYLPALAHQEAAHRTIAEYFSRRLRSRRELDDLPWELQELARLTAVDLTKVDHLSDPPGPRELEELPWQLKEARDWEGLGELLARPTFFDALWQANQFEVKEFWAKLEAESRIRMESVYADVVEDPSRDYSHAWLIGILLADTGKREAALRVRARLTEYFRGQGDRANLATSIGNYAVLLHDCGNLDAAMALYDEQELLCRELNDVSGLSKALGNQARTLRLRGDLNRAMTLYKASEDLCRELGDSFGLQGALGGRAIILRIQGDLDGALALHQEEEHLNRELGNKHELV